MSKFMKLLALAAALALAACAATYNGGYPESWIIDKSAAKPK